MSADVTGEPRSQNGGPPGTTIRIELHPPCLLTPSSARQFFLVTCVITLAVSAAAASYGAWPAVIFAVLELLALYCALQLSLRRGRDSEVIEVTEQEVRVVVRAGKRCTGTCLLRHWAHVRFEAAVSPSQRSRLYLECHGRKHELGSFLTEAELEALAVRLKRLIGRSSESPALISQSTSQALVS